MCSNIIGAENISMRHRKPPKLYDQHLEYIDPLGSQSSIGYILSKNPWGGFNAEVELANCDRKISWQFDNQSKEDYDRSLIKIDNALRILTRFREAYVKYAPLHRRKKK
jgi:hypothetical protein